MVCIIYIADSEFSSNPPLSLGRVGGAFSFWKSQKDLTNILHTPTNNRNMKDVIIIQPGTTMSALYIFFVFTGYIRPA